MQKSQLTLSALLEQGCQKARGGPPIKENFETNDGQHVTILRVDRFRGESMSRNRKTAQHMAARAVLLQIVEACAYAEFGIPGSTREEARAFIQSLQPDLGQEDQLAKENWPGKCDELCAQRKLPRKPQYEFAEAEVERERRFVCTSTLLGLSATAHGTSKKKAKAAAAMAMHKLMEEHLKPPPPRAVDVLQSAPSASGAERGAAEEEPELEAPPGQADWLRRELRDRHLPAHLEHRRCPGSDALFRRIAARARAEPAALPRPWPGFGYAFQLDLDNLTRPLAANAADTARLQESARARGGLDYAEFNVFLDILVENQIRNVFAGTAAELADARDLAACAALCYLKSYVDEHSRTT